MSERLGPNSRTRLAALPSTTARAQYKKPDEVAVAVGQALFEEKPKRRYMVVPEQREAEITIRKQIEQLVQLNEGQSALG